MIAISPDYFKRLVNAANTQVVGADIPPVESVFDLKSGCEPSWSIAAVRW